jgi:uncharacterized RDD family membrane protein YckC
VTSRQLYAGVPPRLQAYLRDSLVQIAIVVVCMTAAVMVGTPAGTRASVIACIALLLLYEPICIALAGGTVGHVSLGLRIVRARDFGRVSFGRALARSAAKFVLGYWVFMAVYFTRRSQGLHDLVAGTVVVPRAPSAVAPRGFAFEKAR